MSAPIAVLGAMPEETAALLARGTLREKTSWADIDLHRVTLEGREAVVARSGIGKVLAAMTCQKIIDAYSPRAVLFTGVAGALNPAYDIGDVVVARDLIQHDMDATALGFPRGTVPYTDTGLFTPDPALRARALSTPLPGRRFHEGRILTGDRFMTHAQIETHRYLIDDLRGDAIEMEGASVAQVCAANKIPFAVIRCISDRADGNAAVDFARFLPEAAHASCAVVRHILAGLPETPGAC